MLATRKEMQCSIMELDNSLPSLQSLQNPRQPGSQRSSFIFNTSGWITMDTGVHLVCCGGYKSDKLLWNYAENTVIARL